jgi:hypothetical protein
MAKSAPSAKREGILTAEIAESAEDEGEERIKPFSILLTLRSL